MALRPRILETHWGIPHTADCDHCNEREVPSDIGTEREPQSVTVQDNPTNESR